MELKLNFKLGQETINGRIYNVETLKAEFDRVLSETGMISVGPDTNSIDKSNGSVPDEVLVGVAKSYRVDEDGTVYFDIHEMSEQTEKWLQDNPDIMKLTLFGFGNIKDNKIVGDFKLGCLFMTQDEGK